MASGIIQFYNYIVYIVAHGNSKHCLWCVLLTGYCSKVIPHVHAVSLSFAIAPMHVNKCHIQCDTKLIILYTCYNESEYIRHMFLPFIPMPM